MNRSILIVICDFLLVSLLVFSSPDVNKVGEGAVRRTAKMAVASAPVDTGQDLAAAMKMALDEERKNRNQLLSELAKSREAITDREKQTEDFQRQLRERDERTLRLQQQQSVIQQQFASAQTNIQRLNQQLQSTSTEAVISKEKMAALEAEARKQSEQAAALQRQLNDMARSNQVALAEKQQLSTQLQVAQAEQRAATQQVALMTDEVKAERVEKAKLAEGVKALATKSGQLAEQIRENQPLAPNTIFNDFVTNRVEAKFTAARSGFFGANRHKEAETILVSDGTNTYALCHVQDTPLTFWDPGTDWEALTGGLSRNWANAPIQSMYFSLQDPRIVWLPVTQAEVRQLGCKVYRISANPYKFQDAVLVGTQEAYYGECRFEIDLSTPDYVKLDRDFLKGLFGKFNPSRGDLVFSKTGELLGIMANGTYCLMIRNFDAGATVTFGDDVRSQHTGAVLSQLYAQVAQFPMKLQ